MNASQAWCCVTRRCRFVIIALSMLSLCSYKTALKLLDRADGNFRLVSGSESRQASKKMQTLFPSLARTQASIVLTEGNVTSPAFCDFQFALTEAIQTRYPCESTSCFVRSVESWCALAVLAPELAEPLMSGGKRAIISVTYDAKASQGERNRLNDWVKRRATSLGKQYGFENVGYTGFDPLVQSGLDGSKKDLENVDSRSLPLALLVMAITLGNLPLILIPILCMLFATVTEFFIMSWVATVIDVVSFAPSVMMTLTLALSFDYSLFFCSRYVQAREDGRDPRHRVVEVLETAGHTVIVSGTTLVACFLGLLCFKSSVLRGLAVSVTVGLGCALLYNLVLTPAIFHVAGERLCKLQDRLDDFWATNSPFSSRKIVQSETTTNDGDEYRPLQDDHKSADDDDDNRKAPGQRRQSPYENRWERLTRLLWDDRRIALGVVCAVVAFSAPACMRALDLVSLADPTLDSPSPSDAEHAYQRVERHFGGGAVAPYYVVFDTVETGGDALSQSSLDSVDNFIFGDIANATKEEFTAVSISRLGNRRLNASDYESCFAGSTDPQCPSLLLMAAEYVSPDRSSSLTQILLRGNAYSRGGFNFVRNVRRRLDHNPTVYRGVYLDGVAAQLHDVIDALYDSFPIVVIVTLLVVFSLLGVSFRSIAVPLRSIIALCLTLSFAFGTVVIVYQRHQVTTVSFLSTRGHGSGIAWLAPLICFSVIVGLALDYDVFLLARIYEYRFSKRLDDRSSLLSAVAHTGTIITAAGCIMAVAFGGLFFSRTVILNQCAWLLTSAVLYDTLVIRTLFMPSLISLSRGYAWWPARLPDPTQLPELEETEDASTVFTPLPHHVGEEEFGGGVDAEEEKKDTMR